MRLIDIDFDNTFETSIYCERHINDSKGRFEVYSTVNPMYDPQGAVSEFMIPFMWVKDKDINVYQDNPSSNLIRRAFKNNRYKFYWHPDTERMGLSVSGYDAMQPTSSTRTLLGTKEPYYYVKTDLDKKHFRFIRRLKESSISHSVKISSELRSMIVKPGISSTYSFLPESLGLVLSSGVHQGSGVIFRETKPFPLCADKRVILPYHSLYARDPFSSEEEPLLIQLCEIHSPNDPIGFFIEYIIGYIQDSWVLLLTNLGFLPELHGQNALIEIDENFFPKRMVHRDFQGTYSDSAIRTALGLPNLDKHQVGLEPGTTRDSQYSLVYDNMIGKYLFSRLANVFCSYYTNYSYRSYLSRNRPQV